MTSSPRLAALVLLGAAAAGGLPAARATSAAFNARVRAFTAEVGRANAIARTSNRAQPGYEKVRDRCLRAFRDWAAATADLVPALAPASQAAGTARPSVVCDAPSAAPARQRFHEFGYVVIGTTEIHLAAETCLGLERVIAHPRQLRCVRTARPRYVSRPVGLSDAALALVTLAHEQQHVDGTRNEAETECHAYQRVAAAAAALGVPRIGRPDRPLRRERRRRAAAVPVAPLQEGRRIRSARAGRIAGVVVHRRGDGRIRPAEREATSLVHGGTDEERRLRFAAVSAGLVAEDGTPETSPRSHEPP